ncbi:preprotein translocase subunit SecG [Bacteroidales bacterium OttesenSCG-928-A17]|nr:preprotein translocase subunit SecG [Bacteroidales bacterium OttesenSCG-928-A17]
MFIFITVLIVIVSLLLIFFVVIQNSKGGGLAAGFSSSNQVMGVRKTTDFLEKATWVLAGTIVLLSVAASFFIPKATVKENSAIKEQLQNMLPQTPNAVAPFGTAVPADEAGEESTEAPTE